jgi:hypothetical protein
MGKGVLSGGYVGKRVTEGREEGVNRWSGLMEIVRFYVAA